MRKPNEFTRILQIGMMLVLPIGLASCTRDEGEEMETPEETNLPDTNDVNAAAEPVEVDINGVESDVDGQATITRVGESLMVSLTLEKLAGEGPFRGQIVSGRCEDREDQTPNRTETGRNTTPGQPTTPGATPPAGTTTPAAQQVLATLEPIQVAGATGQPTPATEKSGMSQSTVPVADLRGMRDVHIEVQGTGARTIACGNITDMDKLLLGGTGGATVAPMTPSPTTPGGATPPSSAPGARP
jgi:hypothetical protein